MNKSFINWWRNIDKVIFILAIILLSIGIVLSLTSTTEIQNFSSTYFIKRHLIFSLLSVGLIILISFQDVKLIRRLSLIGFFVSLGLILIILMFGYEINGSKRWLPILGFTIQPSEFLKPFFVVISAWFITKGLEGKKFGFTIIIPLFILSSFLLILQPDFGMTVLFMAVFFSQLFVAGLSIIFVFMLVIFILGVVILSYIYIENVRLRFNIFFDPSKGDTYQIEQSIKAFKSGGLTGKGLGQGTLKDKIPDAHTDFIFSVAGEELGYIFCSLLIFIFLIIIIRSLLLILKKREPYSLILVAGLVSIFGLQALINIASSIGAAPTKGMTLPLISYGGSSMVSSSILIGILLSHTKGLKRKE